MVTRTVMDAGVLRDAVQLACRAPSLHNSQPWRFVAVEAGLQLFLDTDRVVESTDDSGPRREAIISCGGVLDHLRVAIAAAGWDSTVDRFPDPNNPNHLASVDFSPLAWVTDGHRKLADAILRRRTDRLPFGPPAHWESCEPLLRSALDGDAVHLDVVPDQLRSQLAEASALTESLRLYDSSYHAELAWWTAPFQTSDGIPPSALVSAAESDRVDVGRTFPVTGHGDRRAEIDEDRSTVLVLSTGDSGRQDALRAGEALSRVLLECTTAGLATCSLTHLTELAASRDLINTLIGRTGVPQVLIRVGQVPAITEVPPMTPRRPLREVLEWRPELP